MFVLDVFSLNFPFMFEIMVYVTLGPLSTYRLHKLFLVSKNTLSEFVWFYQIH